MRSLVSLVVVFGLAGCGGGTTVPVSAGSAALLSSSTTPSSTTASTTTTSPSTTPTAPAADASFALLLNAVRFDNGAAAVTHDALLDQAAQNHAQDMLDNGYFSHTGLNGSDLRDRVNATGYDWRAIGENIGMGQQTEQAIMDGWTGSPGHHANNINPVFEEFGLGYAREGFDTRWVLVLGTPR